MGSSTGRPDTATRFLGSSSGLAEQVDGQLSRLVMHLKMVSDHFSGVTEVGASELLRNNRVAFGDWGKPSAKLLEQIGNTSNWASNDGIVTGVTDMVMVWVDRQGAHVAGERSAIIAVVTEHVRAALQEKGR